MTTSPLHNPACVDALTPFERALFRVPALRTLLRWPLRNQRELRLERAVREQMDARAAFDADAWGDDPLRHRVAQAVGDAFARALGLRQPHLHPDDAIDLLLFDRDFLVGAEIRQGIEDALDRSFPDDCYDGWETAGGLVDRLVEHLPR